LKHVYDVFNFFVAVLGCQSENNNRSNYLLHYSLAGDGCQCCESWCRTQGSMLFSCFFSV